MIISGFQADTNIESVHKVLSDNGLPDSKTVSDLSRNDKNGKITIAELSPENCLLLIEKLHGKSFLDKKVFVTSIVSASPQKHAPNKEVPLASEVSSPATPCIEGPVGTEEIAESTAHSRSVTAPLPSVTTPSKSNFDNPETQVELSQAQTSGVNSEKRKASSSPEQSDLSKKEKKKLKDIARSTKKQEEKIKKQVILSPSN